jgi:hypothetical protein
MRVKLYTIIIGILHAGLVGIVSLVLLFSTDLFTLAFVNSFMLFVLVLNYLFDDCPISLIEDKHTEKSSLHRILSYTINIHGEKYNKALRSVLTLELIWIGLLLGAEKMMLLLLFRKRINANIE